VEATNDLPAIFPDCAEGSDGAVVDGAEVDDKDGSDTVIASRRDCSRECCFLFSDVSSTTCGLEVMYNI
jgi:hypothetical protein